jgi:hypothetical protein
MVCGHQPGDVVDVADLAGGDVAHLMSAGHIEPVKDRKPSAVKVADTDNLDEEMSDE